MVARPRTPSLAAAQPFSALSIVRTGPRAVSLTGSSRPGFLLEVVQALQARGFGVEISVSSV